jgi:hypothetical protein
MKREDKAQSESRDSKEGSMSPIDLSKFTDEEYVAPQRHQGGDLYHVHVHHHGEQQEQQTSDDAMDWLDQATNTTHYFADPLDTFMQNFQNANAGGGGSSEDADYGGMHAHETHFSLDSRIFENDSQPGTSGVHVDAFNSKTTTSPKKPSSLKSPKSKSSNKSSSSNNNNNNNTSNNTSVQRSTSFTKPRKTSSFKKSNLSGVKKASSQVDLTKAFSDLEQGMMHLNSEQIQPGVMRRIPSEIRMQQLARYREKRARRRLGHKKIRYECRKTLADNRPRYKGRFAKIIPTVASEGNLSTMSAPEPGEGVAAMNDVLDSMEAKSKKAPRDENTASTKSEQQTKKENMIKNANEKAAMATRKTRAETAAAAVVAAATRKTRANSNSKGSEETNDSETAESDLFSIEVPKRTRAMRRLQSNARGLRVSQSEVSLVKLVES